MRKFFIRLTNTAIVFILVSCVTVDDIQHATDLIRTDNELTRLLVEVRPGDQAGAATYLLGLAAHAKSEADAIKEAQARAPDAIAYYRIAATAYWRSGDPGVGDHLFLVTENGMDLCSGLGDSAPDRDCVFLQLVLPFAGLESKAKDPDLSALLEGIDFNDGNASRDEIEDMALIRQSLIQIKPLIRKILAVGTDESLLSHPSMAEYYCSNAKQAFSYYDSTAAVFTTKAREYQDNFPNNAPALDITLDEARNLRKLDETIPSICQ